MSEVLADADFAHPVTTRFIADGELEYFPWNYGRAEFREVGRERKGSMGLTGVAHTLEAYRQLPYGWRTTPDGMPSDHYMWLQWLDAPGVRMALSERITYLNFPDPFWRELPEDERASVLESWLQRSREPGFAEEVDTMLATALREAAEDYHLWAWSEQNAVKELRGTRTWRARERLLSLRASAIGSTVMEVAAAGIDGLDHAVKDAATVAADGDLAPGVDCRSRDPTSSHACRRAGHHHRGL